MQEEKNQISSKCSVIKEFCCFLMARKKWWLIPLVILLMILGALIVFAEGSALAPLIYTIF